MSGADTMRQAKEIAADLPAVADLETRTETSPATPVCGTATGGVTSELAGLDVPVEARGAGPEEVRVELVYRASEARRD